MSSSSERSDVGSSRRDTPPAALPREVADDLRSLLSDLREPAATPDQSEGQTMQPDPRAATSNDEEVKGDLIPGVKRTAPERPEPAVAKRPSEPAVLPADVTSDLESLFAEIREPGAGGASTTNAPVVVPSKPAAASTQPETIEPSAVETTASGEAVASPETPASPETAAAAADGEVADDLKNLLGNIEKLLIDLREPAPELVATTPTTAGHPDPVSTPGDASSGILRAGPDSGGLFSNLAVEQTEAQEIIDLRDGSPDPEMLVLDGDVDAGFDGEAAAIPEGWTLGKVPDEPSRWSPSRNLRRFRTRVQRRFRSFRLSEWRAQRRHRRDNRRYSDQLF